LASQPLSYVLHFQFHETLLTIFLRTFNKSASNMAKFGNFC
jgi:hypothetical protein